MAQRKVVGERAQQEQGGPTAEERAVMDREIAEEEEAERRRQARDALDLDTELVQLEDELREVSGSKIKVSRKTSARGSPGGYCFSINSGDMTLDELIDKIRDEYGGGQYRIRVHGTGGQLRFNRDIDVLEPLNRLENKSPPAAQQQDGLAAVLMEIQRSNQLQAESFRELMLNQSQQNSAMLLDIIKADRGREAAPAGQNILETITLLKALIPEEKKQDSFELFLRGLEMGREMNDDAGGKSMLQTAVETFGAPLAAIVAAQQGKSPQALQPRPQAVVQREPVPGGQASQLPAPEPLAQEMAGGQQEQGGVDIVLEILKRWEPLVQIVINAATLDSDPVVYAEILLDQMAPEDLEMLLIREDNYQRIFDYAPQLAGLRQWFDELRNAVLELVKDDQIDDQKTDEESDQNVRGESGSTDVPGTAARGEEVDN